MAAPKRAGAGALNSRVTFQRRVEQEDEFGNVESDWVDQFDEPCRLTPRMGSEAVVAARLAGVQPYSMTVRGSERTRSVTPAWRAVNARTGVEYQIRTCANIDERDAYIEMMVQSGVAT
jgi:head-tail adaptor